MGQSELRAMSTSSITSSPSTTTNLQNSTELTSRWTSSGLRPLAEAPYVAPCVFERALPSEKRYQMLFPRDPEKRAKMKDLDGELEALYQYRLQISAGHGNRDEASGRQRFYDGLAMEVEADHEALRKEAEALYFEATVLGRFEYTYSDNGSTAGSRGLEALLRRGGDVLYCEHPDVRGKYGELFERTRKDREDCLKKYEERQGSEQIEEEQEGLKYGNV